MLERIYGGDVDILVGIQMLVKGYDFLKLILVGVLGVDLVLFVVDWCVLEWFFVQFMQVVGWVGWVELKGEVLVQMEYLDYFLYFVLVVYDYLGFVVIMFKECEQVGFLFYVFQVMLCVEVL